MDDAPSVRVIERAGHLEDQIRSLIRRNRARIAKKLPEGDPAHELHHHVEHAVLDTELEDRDDVGVRQPHARLRLIDEPSNEGLIGAELRPDQLHDELFLEALGAGHRREEDLRHPAAREASLQQELTERRGKPVDRLGLGHRRAQVSNSARLFALLLLGAGCGAPAAEVRPITARTLLDCPLRDGDPALELEALDDGEPRATSFVEVVAREPREVETLPQGARAFLVRGRGPGLTLTSLGILTVEGARASGPLYRASTACAFSDGAGARARFPVLEAPSVASVHGVAVIAGGRDRDGEARSDLILVDGLEGTATRLGLRRRRADNAVAIVGDRALVAGGSAGGSGGGIWEDAEVIDLGTRAVLPDAIALAEKRSHAAAVAMASGEVLLVGGAGPSGPLRTMEILDPTRRVTRTIDVASLARARKSPRAVRLSTGELLVVGGTDEAGAPVPDIEVFDARGEQRLATWPLLALANVAVAALPSGAALIVHADNDVTRAVLARADGVSVLPNPPHRGRPRLVAATDGAPFLFDGSFTRFDPFAQTFAFVALPSALFPDDSIAPFALDHGVIAALRIEDNALALRAVRYDLRPPLVSDAESLGLGSTQHLCPDRPGPTVLRDGLVISPRARVTITDATYRGFVLRLAASGRDLPLVELRSEDSAIVARIGDSACPWPSASAASSEITRERDGAIVVRVGDAVRSCAPLLSRERVAITLIAGTAEARPRGVTITRR